MAARQKNYELRITNYEFKNKTQIWRNRCFPWQQDKKITNYELKNKTQIWKKIAVFHGSIDKQHYIWPDHYALIRNFFNS